MRSSLWYHTHKVSAEIMARSLGPSSSSYTGSWWMDGDNDLRVPDLEIGGLEETSELALSIWMSAE